MPASNSIELLNRETNRIASLNLYRVMGIGHLDEPNAAAKYKAVLRECLPGNNGIDSTVVIPDIYKQIVYEAFEKDLFVLAEFKLNCIETVIMLNQPDFFDAENYVKENGYPKV